MKSTWSLIAAMALTRITVFSQGFVTAFDSFGPGDSYNYQAAVQLWAYDHTGGFRFRPSVSGRLYSVTLPLTSPAERNQAQLGVFLTDPRTGFPSTAVELFSATGLMPPRGATAVAPLTFQSSLAPMLDSSKDYWLVLSVPPTSEANWYAFPGNEARDYYYIKNDVGEGIGRAEPGSAFRVTVAQVPEPLTPTLAVSGLVLLAITQRRRS